MAAKGNLFVHNLRPKRKVAAELTQTLPLPVHDGTLSSFSKIDATFTGYSVDVTDQNSIGILCLNGGFGQGMLSRTFPACVTTPRDTDRKMKRNKAEANRNSPLEDGINEPLCLFLEEAFFLMHQLNVLNLKSITDESIGIHAAFEKFRKIKKGFLASYCAYLYLKSKNWIIKSGMKFGGDFVIYVKGPQFYHASYIVLIHEMFLGKQLSSHVIDGLDFQGFNRIAETTAKDILFLEVHYPTSLNLANNIDCLKKIKDVQIVETFTKHHNYIAARNHT